MVNRLTPMTCDEIAAHTCIDCVHNESLNHRVIPGHSVVVRFPEQFTDKNICSPLCPCAVAKQVHDESTSEG